MLFTHLLFGLPSGLFPSGLPTNNLHVFLLSSFALHDSKFDTSVVLPEARFYTENFNVVINKSIN
jgi:hypothetical protein